MVLKELVAMYAASVPAAIFEKVSQDMAIELTNSTNFYPTTAAHRE